LHIYSVRRMPNMVRIQHCFVSDWKFND
jgi:hypothetical protein